MPYKLTEENVIKQIEDTCKIISTPDEQISFLGFVGGHYKRNTTKLILYNSKLNLSWSTTSFNNFQKRHITFPKHNLPKEKGYLTRNSGRKTTEEFIQELKIKFPDKNWDYSKTVYHGNHKKTCITCHEIDPITGKEHGDLYPTPACLFSNTRTPDCPRCNGKYSPTTEEYIEKASIVHHHRYTYEKTKYVNGRTKICVTCPEHGDFWTTPTGHLYRKYGCPQCKCTSRGEDDIKEYFKSHEIKYSYQFPIESSKIPGCPNRYKVFIDFYLEYNGRKIFIEFNGEQHYRYSPHFQKNFSEFEEQKQRDKSIKEYALNNEYEFLEISYKEVNKISEILDSFLFNKS